MEKLKENKEFCYIAVVPYSSLFGLPLMPDTFGRIPFEQVTIITHDLVETTKELRRRSHCPFQRTGQLHANSTTRQRLFLPLITTWHIQFKSFYKKEPPCPTCTKVQVPHYALHV